MFRIWIFDIRVSPPAPSVRPVRFVQPVRFVRPFSISPQPPPVFPTGHSHALHRSAFIIPCSIFAVRHSLLSILPRLYSAFCLLYSVSCILYSEFSLLPPIQSQIPPAQLLIQHLAPPGRTRQLETPKQAEGWVFLDWKQPLDGGRVIAYKIRRRNRTDGAWLVLRSEFATSQSSTGCRNGNRDRIDFA